MIAKRKAKKKRKKRLKGRICPGCGTSYTKGAIVYRQDGKGRLVGTRVCQGCEGRAVRVLVSDAPAHCIECGENLACFCRGCVGKLVDKGQRNLAALAAMGGKRVKIKGRRKK